MIQPVFPSIIRSSKLHIQRQVFVRLLLLTAASLAGMELQYWSDKHLTLYVQFSAPDDGRKNRLKHAEHLTGINKLRNVASCWLYSANADVLLPCITCYLGELPDKTLNTLKTLSKIDHYHSKQKCGF